MYYVIEHDIRPDGIINTSETQRSSYKSAASLYHERFSKMLMNEDFISVSIMMVDIDLNVIMKDTIETMYYATH